MVSVFDLAAQGVPVVGRLPQGLPGPTLPWTDVTDVGPLALAAVALLALALPARAQAPSFAASGQLAACTDPGFAQMEFFRNPGDAQPTGFDMDLAAALAAKWGASLRVLPTEFKGLLPGLEAGVGALYQKCQHLGCRVPECKSSQWFECPCHGSQYNRAGEKKAGPAPRGMDRFAVTVSASGDVVIDTSIVFAGAPIGTNTTGQEAECPHCSTGGGGSH